MPKMMVLVVLGLGLAAGCRSDKSEPSDFYAKKEDGARLARGEMSLEEYDKKYPGEGTQETLEFERYIHGVYVHPRVRPTPARPR